MKKLITIIAVLVGIQAAAQNLPPQAINFQGVAIDKNGIPVPGIDELGNPIQNAGIKVRFSILEGSATGVTTYREVHETTTDEFGRFNLEIGRGSNVEGVFQDIQWGSDRHFLKVEVDLSSAGTNYQLASIQEFLSVPYALYARTSKSSDDDLDKDPTNELQALTITNDTVLSIANGNAVTLPTSVGPQGPQGLTGATGPQGATGAQGPAGQQGATGALGPQGATGAQGPIGPQGLQGIQGVVGPAGADGKTIISGISAPLSTQGVLGDFYINTTTNIISGPKTGSGWGSGTSLVGPQGVTGATGPQGPAGPTGLTGPVGPQGNTGATGPTGAAGSNGLSAYQIWLANGNNGTEAQYLASLVGPTGPQGPNGPQGVAGPTGSSGPAGANGSTVLNGITSPTSLIGSNGDFYINTNSNTLFGPKSGGVWPTGVSLVGPAGQLGTAGINGKSSLLRSTKITSNSKCPLGGIQVDFGLDSNNNNILDSTEISMASRFILCNSGSVYQDSSYSSNNNISVLSTSIIPQAYRYFGDASLGNKTMAQGEAFPQSAHYKNLTIPLNVSVELLKNRTTRIYVQDTLFLYGTINGIGQNNCNTPTLTVNAFGASCSGVEWTNNLCVPYGGGQGFQFSWTSGNQPSTYYFSFGGTFTKNSGQNAYFGNPCTALNGSDMSIDELKKIIHFGLDIHGGNGAAVKRNHPTFYHLAYGGGGGSGLYINAKYIVLTGTINLSGGNGEFGVWPPFTPERGRGGAGGGGSAVISTLKVIQNNLTFFSNGGSQQSCNIKGGDGSILIIVP